MVEATMHCCQSEAIEIPSGYEFNCLLTGYHASIDFFFFHISVLQKRLGPKRMKGKLILDLIQDIVGDLLLDNASAGKFPSIHDIRYIGGWGEYFYDWSSSPLDLPFC